MLLKNDNQIIRVLMQRENHSLVIDCIKRTMPQWVLSANLSGYEGCPDTELYERTGMPLDRQLSEEEKRIAQERYTRIAGVLPFIGDEAKRSEVIQALSSQQSKQTIRKYLCLYLTYQDMNALAPVPKESRELTQDDKNIRWGLNKFFYTKNKNSLQTAYTMMLKERYCDAQGVLVDGYPSFHQFRYFYRKTRSL